MRPSTALNIALITLALIAFVVLATRSGPDMGIEVERRDPAPGIDEIRVDIRGAVNRPGLYTIEPGDRVGDVVARAGGASPEADLSNVNLALRVRDQDVVHVPAVGEDISPLIDLNAASQPELERLPGIGPVRASAIIEARPYDATDELRARNVIPASVYEQIRTLITAR